MNSFGRLFRIHLFGESHGKYVGITIDGVPAGIKLSIEDFLPDIQRRKPIQKGTTARSEKDIPQIISGYYKSYTTGAPLTIIFENNNACSKDYDNLIKNFRPGHADFTAYHKYHGFNDPRGGGHFSGRLTLPIVAAGVVAKKIIQPVNIEAKVIEIGGKSPDSNIIEEVIEKNDSVGGIIECTIINVPIGLGEPFFDTVESVLAHALLAIPAIKGIEFGSGFKLAQMLGSQANDCFIDEKGTTATNHSGGILGGITNGNPITFRVVVKPPSSIAKEQWTYNFETGTMYKLKIQGRHDACIALRMPPIIEAITACVLADFYLIAKAY